MITIRRLIESDAEAYWKLRLEALKVNSEAFASTYEEMLRQEDPINAVKRGFKETPTFGAFQDDGEQLIAVAKLRLIKLKKLMHKGDILGMYVRPQARKQGAGRKLMEYIIEEARKYHLEQLQLAVVTENRKAKDFYKALGFVTFGHEKNALKDEGKYWDEDHMVLYLNK